MKAEALLELYDRVAGAPNAIGQLRRFVLDLAVRGKLVEQDAEDEPAPKLLMRVAAEHARLIESGLTKEPKSAQRVERSELPFHAPKHWSWCRLVDVARVSYGFAFESARFNGERRGMPLIRIRDISRSDTEAYYDGDFDPSYLVHHGDYLVGMDGDFNLRRWSGGDALLNQRVLRINQWKCGVSPEFVRLPLQMVLDHIHGSTSQTTVKHLSAKQVNGIEIPLAPLAEQQRIVAKVDELMALLDRLEAARSKREATRDHLTTATLTRLTEVDADPDSLRTHARFALDALPALTARADQIQKLRQTILDLAVRGRLSEQRAADRPASVLLSQMNEQRALARSGETPSSPKPSDVPFPLPPGWELSRLGDICSKTGSGSTPRGGREVYQISGIPFLRSQNIYNDGLRLDDVAYIDELTHKKMAGTRVQGGDLLLNITGGSIGRCAQVPKSFGEANISQHVAIIRPAVPETQRFLHCLILSPYFQSFVVGEQTGAGRGGLPKNRMDRIVVPIPPIEEQHRIVAKVDDLMSICDRMEAALQVADRTRVRLLEALLNDALSSDSTERKAA